MTVVPPEGVPIVFEVAGLGARIAAQIVDVLLSLVLAGSLIAVLAIIADASLEVLFGVFSLLFFFIRAPYYVLSELLWNGQTVGKRMMQIRVVNASGRSLAPYAVLVRNLMKEAEVFVPGTALIASPALGWSARGLILAWIAGLLGVALWSRKRQRIGDMAADTCVVRQPRTLLMPDLAAAPAADAVERFVFLPHQLDHYGAYELQTLERLLHASRQTSEGLLPPIQQERLVAVGDRIRQKIDYAGRVDPIEEAAFLMAFYTAQRQHLEKRQLFGDRRADKHYRVD